MRAASYWNQLAAPVSERPSGKNMSPVDYIRAAYRHREKLMPQLLTLLAISVIITYHALTSPLLKWLF